MVYNHSKLRAGNSIPKSVQLGKTYQALLLGNTLALCGACVGKINISKMLSFPEQQQQTSLCFFHHIQIRMSLSTYCKANSYTSFSRIINGYDKSMQKSRLSVVCLYYFTCLVATVRTFLLMKHSTISLR